MLISSKERVTKRLQNLRDTSEDVVLGTGSDQYQSVLQKERTNENSVVDSTVKGTFNYGVNTLTRSELDKKRVSFDVSNLIKK